MPAPDMPAGDLPVSLQDIEKLDADTFPKLLLRHGLQRGQKPAIREKHRGIWRTLTWRDLAEEAAALAAALSTRGLRRGAHVAFVSDNRPRLYAAMGAAHWLGAVAVPLTRMPAPRRWSLRSSAREPPTSSPRIRSRSTSCSRSCRGVRRSSASFTTRIGACGTTSSPIWSATRICCAKARSSLPRGPTPYAPKWCAAPARMPLSCSSPPAPPAPPKPSFSPMMR